MLAITDLGAGKYGGDQLIAFFWGMNVLGATGAVFSALAFYQAMHVS